MKLAIVTLIEPNKKNTGGPSGLIWEIQELLKKYTDIQIDTIVINKSSNKYIAQINTLGFYKSKYKQELNKYDKILLYPDFLLGYMSKDILSKIIVLGPDASSMVGKRKYDVYMQDSSVNWIKKIYQYLYYRRFIYFEKKYIPKVNKFIVVGENDKYWLQNHFRNKVKDKIVFLRHPLLSYSLSELEKVGFEEVSEKRFIFSGDMRYSYVGKNIIAIAENLKMLLSNTDNNISIIVVGKANKWIADIFSKINSVKVQYFSWVEQYQDICQINRDIHCVPLIAGGGTKNRVLTAIANGLELISTDIGVENIPIDGLKNIFVCNNMQDFAKQMITCAQRKIETEKEFGDFIEERIDFRRKITNEFKLEMISFIKDR